MAGVMRVIITRAIDLHRIRRDIFRGGVAWMRAGVGSNGDGAPNRAGNRRRMRGENAHRQQCGSYNGINVCAATALQRERTHDYQTSYHSPSQRSHKRRRRQRLYYSDKTEYGGGNGDIVCRRLAARPKAAISAQWPVMATRRRSMVALRKLAWRRRKPGGKSARRRRNEA